METKQSVTELGEKVLREKERLKYSKTSIRHFEADCKRFSAFVIESIGEDVFSEEIASKYLAEKFDYPSDFGKKLPRDVCDAVRCIRKLGEYQLFGAFSRQWSRQTETQWHLADEALIATYLHSAQTADNRESTRILRTRYLKKFYDFLGFRNLSGISDVSSMVISEYVLTLQGSAPTTVQQLLAALKNYFRFLFRNGYCEQDWSSSVPKVNHPQNLTIPALWEESEIELLLRSIDRNSPSGKRDYAIILLAVQLGLRSSDIAELKLESLKWDRNEIELVQHKTDKNLVHPLVDDVGWAIIDYIRYARPPTDPTYVFLSANAPYSKISAGTVSVILRRHMRFCGIKKPAGTTKGVHSLRHAFARRLLAQGTPLPEVVGIMGHVSSSSTVPYLKVDIDGMRRCSLSLTEELNRV